MAEKIYLGNGKTFGQYDTINFQFEIDKMFGILANKANEAQKKELGSAFRLIHTLTKDQPGFSQFARKENKKGLTINLRINKTKEDASKFYATINDYVKQEQEQSNNPTPPQNEPDDLPF